jgi:putative thiamine transport system ATP-binding protein
LADNLAFGLPAQIKGAAARKAAVEQALAAAGLTGLGARDPETLSGGERARAALMRSLLADPKAILLDEPFSKLDTALRAGIRAFAFDHIRARAIPALIVTHDDSDAAAAGGPVLNLGG